MLYARQSTARTVTVGPVLDANGVAVTGGVVADFKIAKNGGAPAALNGSATATHRHTGFYSLALTASDLDTVGTAEVTIDDTVNSCPLKEISVVEEAVYDLYFAASATGQVTLANGAHGGAAATLTLLSAAISNSGGIGLSVTGTTAGIKAISTAGPALHATGVGGAGAKFEGTNGNNVGLDLAGFGSGAGIRATGGATGNGVSAIGGATSGGGFVMATTDGDAFKCTGAGTGVDIRGDITGDITGTLSTLTTYTGNTPQTGDAFAYLGTNLGALGANATEAGGTGDHLTAINLPNQTMDITGNITGNLSGSVGSVTGAVGSVTGAVGSVSTGGITRATFAADTGLQTIRSNTAQAGGNTSITLDASASAVDDFYKNSLIYLTGGTGVGQGRFISAYNGTTKVATVATWATNPDNTSTFAILPFGSIPGATAPTASEVADEVQTRTIAAVTTVTTTTNLTNLPAITANWLTAAGLAADAVAEIADAVWDEDATGHQTVGTFGQAIGDPGADTTTIYQSVVTDAAGANIAADIIDIEGKVDDVESLASDVNGKLPTALTLGGNMKCDVVAWLGTAPATPTTAGVPEVDMTHISGSAVSTSSAQIGVDVRRWKGATPADLAGDSSNMVQVLLANEANHGGASAVITGAIVGNITGNLSGSVASVTGGINTGSGVITTLDALDTAQDTQHGTTQTAIADVPTVAEFEARTIAAASYATPTNITAASGVALTSAYDFAKGTVAMTESYNADGAAPTPAQALFVIMQSLTEGSIAGTTWTIKKIDGSTTALTVTLDDATTPTSKTRAT
jgi:hypothetical protein